jgi:hypothetical protein
MFVPPSGSLMAGAGSGALPGRAVSDRSRARVRRQAVTA